MLGFTLLLRLPSSYHAFPRVRWGLLLTEIPVFRSNDYTSTDSTSPWKAMLLNKVVVGKGYKILHDNPTMTAPPAGYDSVSRATPFFDRSKANYRVH